MPIDIFIESPRMDKSKGISPVQTRSVRSSISLESLTDGRSMYKIAYDLNESQKIPKNAPRQEIYNYGTNASLDLDPDIRSSTSVLDHLDDELSERSHIYDKKLPSSLSLESIYMSSLQEDLGKTLCNKRTSLSTSELDKFSRYFEQVGSSFCVEDLLWCKADNSSNLNERHLYTLNANQSASSESVVYTCSLPDTDTKFMELPYLRTYRSTSDLDRLHRYRKHLDRQFSYKSEKSSILFSDYGRSSSVLNSVRNCDWDGFLESSNTSSSNLQPGLSLESIYASSLPEGGDETFVASKRTSFSTSELDKFSRYFHLVGRSFCVDDFIWNRFYDQNDEIPSKDPTFDLTSIEQDKEGVAEYDSCCMKLSFENLQDDHSWNSFKPRILGCQEAKTNFAPVSTAFEDGPLKTSTPVTTKFSQSYHR